jgi:hypothetical protein
VLESHRVTVLQKCANPDCDAQFRYLHEGKLFEVEIQYREGMLGSTQHEMSAGKIELWWLCNKCAPRVTLRFDKQHGLLIGDSLTGSREAVTTKFRQSNKRDGAEISRVLIRLLGLNLKVRQNLSSRLKSQIRAAA